jgi:hypothetical protein
MYTVYDHPKDYPHEYVVRRFEIRPNEVTGTAIYAHAATLAEVRRPLRGMGLSRIGRHESDDLVIVEVWL